MKLKERITPYVQAVPKILGFKLLTAIVLAIISSLLMLLSRALMRSTGRVSVSSGDFTFLFTTWQGYLMIAIMLVIVLLYVAVEVNALIIYISKILHGENPSVFKCIGKGIAGLKKYLNYRGIIIILYCTLISPMLGLGFSISLTSTFYIPNFITSVIFKNPFYTAGVIALVTFLIVVGIIYCFILHGALIDDMSIKEASIQSRQFLKKNWKNYIFEMLRFLLISAIVLAAMYALFILVPSLIIDSIATDDKAGMFATTLISTFALALFCLFEVLWSAYLIMKLTVLYHNYKSEGEWKYTRPAKKAHPMLIIFAVLGVLLIVGISAVYTYYFDDIIPAFTHAQYVGHRAGGVEAPENTVKGIEVAAELNAFGCEIDIQRTSDGYYVVNHDNDFKRVAGVAKKPSEMTLAEVKQLKVDGEPVPTYEEMLDASKDKVTLFVELKGETADEKMADDAVKAIKEKGMEKQAVLISLKYDILEYIEQKYPEMETGYLAFFSFGNIEEMPFDYLALEEEISTDEAIENIHAKNKKVMVWTVNDPENIKTFLNSEADAIITDEVKKSKEISDDLKKRTPREIIYDLFGTWTVDLAK